MYKQAFTLRKKEILTKLLNSDTYITVNSVAQDLKLSSRTILRELEELNFFLNEIGLNVESKTGVGIRLSTSLEQRMKLLEQIGTETQAANLSPDERLTFIASELFASKEPVKIYSLTKSLGVSEGTVINDLDKLEKWMATFSIVLVRKPGLGIYAEGGEKNKRKAIISLIYDHVEEKQLLSMVQSSISRSQTLNSSIEIATSNRLLNLIDRESIKDLEKLVLNAEKLMPKKLADSSYVGLIVHLALAVQRIKNNEQISIDLEYLNKLKSFPEFDLARMLATEISKHFGISIHEEETGYITMHLMGSKNRGILKGDDYYFANFELVQMVKEVIKILEEETGTEVSDKQSLANDLTAHLEPAVKRLKMGMDIRNPLLKEIKKNYPSLMKLSKICIKPIEDNLGIELPESEIAYIAMHLGASVNYSDDAFQKRLRVALTCPSGIGTSRLLASQITKEYKNLIVVDILSTINIDESFLESNGIDLVISTTPINIKSVPAILVNPILTEFDRKNLKRVIEITPSSFVETDKEKPISLRDLLTQLKDYSIGIIQVLDNFFIDNVNVDNVDSLIDFVSSKILIDENERLKLKGELIQREEMGGTHIVDKEIVLVHCLSSSIEKLIFGAVNFTHPIPVSSERNVSYALNLAVIILAPKKCPKEHKEVLSELSGLLVDDPDFIVALKMSDFTKSYKKINRHLENFYNKKSSARR